MLPAGFPEALRLIYDCLAGLPVCWVITGSSNFALRGAPLQPGDIDLQTDEAGAYALAETLAEYVVRPVGYRESLEKGMTSNEGRVDVTKAGTAGLRKSRDHSEEEPSSEDGNGDGEDSDEERPVKDL